MEDIAHQSAMPKGTWLIWIMTWRARDETPAHERRGEEKRGVGKGFRSKYWFKLLPVRLNSWARVRKLVLQMMVLTKKLLMSVKEPRAPVTNKMMSIKTFCMCLSRESDHVLCDMSWGCIFTQAQHLTCNHFAHWGSNSTSMLNSEVWSEGKFVFMIF